MRNDLTIVDTENNEQFKFKQPQDFSHELFGYLTVITNEYNEAFFISNEVSEKLGYSANKKLLERLDDDEKIKLNYKDAIALLRGYQINTKGIQLITEDGLYDAILGSQKIQAKPFKRWVKSVLKEIRKTGSYGVVTQPKIKTALELAKEQVVLLEIIEHKDTVIETLTDEIETNKPKVEFADNLEETKGTILIGELAKLIAQKTGFDIGEKRLFKWFRDNKILMSRTDTVEDFEYSTTHNFPYQKYMKYFHIKEHTVTTPNKEKLTFTTRINMVGQPFFLNKIVRLINKGEFII